ncbi:hypothetical protein ACSHWC_17955 [Pseudomonas fluorescens]
MGIEYDKPRLAGIISDAITNHFLEMIPQSPSAEEVRKILEEAIEVVVRTTAILHDDFEARPAELLAEGRQHSKANAERYLKIILGPGSKAWGPGSI